MRASKNPTISPTHVLAQKIVEDLEITLEPFALVSTLPVYNIFQRQAFQITSQILTE